MKIFLLPWRPAVAIFLSLFVCIFLTCRKEPPLRLTEARLSGFDAWTPCTNTLAADRVVETVRCGPAEINLPAEFVSLDVSECDDKMNTAAEAVRLFVYVDVCTDAAIEKLEALEGPHPTAAYLTDLAGAYYVRAQRRNQPSDFVRALHTAARAVQLPGATDVPNFNYALALEALGFDDDAIESWQALRRDAASPWEREAKDHHERLLARRSHTAAAQWPSRRLLLPDAAARGDHRAVLQLIAPYRRTVQRLVEEDLLPAWAEASIGGDQATADQKLRFATAIAMAASEPPSDRYLLDAVERIRSIRDPRVTALLHEGYAVLASTRAKDTTPEDYARAAEMLRAAASPSRYAAMLQQVRSLTQIHRFDEAWAVVETIEATATSYPSIIGKVHAARSLLFMHQSRDLDAYAESSQARKIFHSIGDRENAARMQSDLGGLLRQIGHVELTWRAAYQAQRDAGNLVDPQARHIQLGENALSAVALGYPDVAVRYQNEAVLLLQKELSTAPDATLEKLRKNLGIALRTRAGIYALLKDVGKAEADLAASARMAEEGNVDIPLAFQARLLEVQAHTFVGRGDRRSAIDALSRGVDLAAQTSFLSLAASLRIQRAELYRLDGNHAAAAEDLESAVASLRTEEKAALESRAQRPRSPERGFDERLWSAVFARAQKAYRSLIDLHVAAGDDVKAFEYAEKARGYEPLQRILERDDLPDSFRDRLHDDEPLGLADVQQYLPEGTFLLEYSVHDDHTYVWVVGRRNAQRLKLDARESEIRRWTRSLQRFASLRDTKRFEGMLGAPYDALLKQPLAVVARWHKTTSEANIVIVPDRSMHGLPFVALRHGNRYLIEDHAVSVSGSATLYAFSRVRGEQLEMFADQSVLLFADPTVDPRLDLKLEPLINARTEVARIREVYSSVARVEPPRTGGDATVPEFLRRAADSSIIHLAVHGFPNPDVPSRSFLLLAPAGSDTGAIDAERLSNVLHLTRARLAVLSACSTAGGTAVGPEGLSPLVRPLIVAGVPGVVGTLWKVSDSYATEDLLVRFHRYYRDGRDADDALRQAQLDMLGRPEEARRAPWGWSAFQVIGDAPSPFPASADMTRRTQ
ncbi:MAG TPA: CHAT domain-containing protein [Thermoanaerobaculia bacterium]|nr:CHAT domain-containing protein [Thermoanaerobaculia bacterium]